MVPLAVRRKEVGKGPTNWRDTVTDAMPYHRNAARFGHGQNANSVRLRRAVSRKGAVIAGNGDFDLVARSRRHCGAKLVGEEKHTHAAGVKKAQAYNAASVHCRTAERKAHEGTLEPVDPNAQRLAEPPPKTLGGVERRPEEARRDSDLQGCAETLSV